MTSRADLDNVLLLNPIVGLEALQVAGYFQETMPEVQGIVGFGGGDEGHKDLWSHTKVVVSQCPEDVITRWAALYHDVGKPRSFKRNGPIIEFHGHEVLSGRMFQKMAARTKLFTKEEIETITFLVTNLGQIEAYESDWTDSAVRRLHKLCGVHFDRLIGLASADITTKNEGKRTKYRGLRVELRGRAEACHEEDNKVPPLVTGLGNILAEEFGVTGKELGALMTKAKAAVEEGLLPVQAEASSVVAYLRTNSPLGENVKHGEE